MRGGLIRNIDQEFSEDVNRGDGTQIANVDLRKCFLAFVEIEGDKVGKRDQAVE